MLFFRLEGYARFVCVFVCARAREYRNHHAKRPSNNDTVPFPHTYIYSSIYIHAPSSASNRLDDYFCTKVFFFFGAEPFYQYGLSIVFVVVVVVLIQFCLLAFYVFVFPLLILLLSLFCRHVTIVNRIFKATQSTLGACEPRFLFGLVQVLLLDSLITEFNICTTIEVEASLSETERDGGLVGSESCRDRVYICTMIVFIAMELCLPNRHSDTYPHMATKMYRATLHIRCVSYSFVFE